MSITMPWNHGLLCRGPKAEAILTSPAASRATGQVTLRLKPLPAHLHPAAVTSYGAAPHAFSSTLLIFSVYAAAPSRFG